MIWKKARDAARDWCGGVHPKLLYAGVQSGSLRAARIGAGRNLLFCEQWCDEWLQSSAAGQRNAPAENTEGRLGRRACRSTIAGAAT